MCNLNLKELDQLTSLTPWRSIGLLYGLTPKLKQGDATLPDYVQNLARQTIKYEEALRQIWQEFKGDPSTSAADTFIKNMMEVSRDMWPLVILEILGIDEPTDEQKAFIEEKLAEHHGYMQNSLHPDIRASLGLYKKAPDEDKPGWFDRLNYRTIFLYAGALWAVGNLVNIYYDGKRRRSLKESYYFLGPNDAEICIGSRGCKTFTGRKFTVGRIISENIFPGQMRCLTSCRHILVPEVK